MNISSLIDKIDLFEEQVVDSGFVRDIDAYGTALGQAETQSNLVALKAIAEKLRSALVGIEASGLSNALDILLPNAKAFTDLDVRTEIEELLNDPSVDTATFFSRLNEILGRLRTQVKSDVNNVSQVKDVFKTYIPEEDTSGSEADKAVLSIILKDLETIRSLKKFAKVLERWNRTLLLYHQLVKSEPPEDIELIAVQNGSIDVVFNLDVKVGLDLTQLVMIGLNALTAYLLYKSKVRDIVEGFGGNKKLIEMEAEREKLMLENIQEVIEKRALEQHKTRKKEDRTLSNEGVTTKVQQISKTLAEQLIKGNEVKLLSAPSDDEHSGEDETTETTDTRRELRRYYTEINELKQKLDPADVKLLTERYSEEDAEKS